MIGPWSEWWIEGSKVVLIGPGTVVLSGNNSCNGVFQLEGRPTYPQQNSFSVSLSLGIFLCLLWTLSHVVFLRGRLWLPCRLIALRLRFLPVRLSALSADSAQLFLFCLVICILPRRSHAPSTPVALCFCPFKFASLFQLSFACGLALRRPVERSGRYEEALQQQRDQRWC